jgi:quinoprotein dehydrogenase-associated probable ABC transporter substrate-binding protein
MSSAFKLAAALLAVAAGLLLWSVASHRDRPAGLALRVCADPNNLPYSNQQRQGFENAIADLVARDLGRRVEYVWWPQRRGFVRTTLRANVCDVVIGVPASFDLTLNTRPYYASDYVFVSRQDRHLDVRSFDDPRLRTLSIGVHVVGDDYANVPPADALAARHIIGNVHGYSVYGDYSRPNPPADLIAAVARGDVDIAIAWGPLAGYFAAQSDVPLEITPADHDDTPGLTFAIAMGVRLGNTRLRRQLDSVIARRQPDIVAVLDRFHVPRIDTASTTSAGRTTGHSPAPGGE